MFMKKVLIVAYYWPPSGGSGVQRWVKFVKYLQDEGWTPVVYTPENPEYTAVDKTLEAEVPANYCCLLPILFWKKTEKPLLRPRKTAAPIWVFRWMISVRLI